MLPRGNSVVSLSCKSKAIRNDEQLFHGYMAAYKVSNHIQKTDYVLCDNGHTQGDISSLVLASVGNTEGAKRH